MFVQRRVLGIFLLFMLTLVFMSCSTVSRLDSLREKQLTVSQMMAEHDIPAFPSTFPVYYNSGAEWNARSLELIESAEDYILLSTFLGVEHPSTLPVWKALAKKAEEGVRVHVIIDSSSNFQMIPISNERIKAAFMYLRELGIETVEYNSLSLSNIFYIPKLLDRDHRKYWVIDGETLVVGGINVNQTSLDWPPGLGNVDTMAEFTSPGATRSVVDSFVDTWNRYSPKPLASSQFSVNESIPESGEHTSLWLVDHYWPSQSRTSALFDLFSLYAQEELWLIQGYTFLTPALLARIRYAADSGVAVHVMLSENATQPKYALASQYGVLDLIDAGATVYMFESPNQAHLHVKMMVADNTLVTMGSTNYNLRSQTLSRELNILFEDTRVASHTMSYIQELMAHCRIISREEAESYRNFRSWFNYLLMQVWG